MSASVSLPVSRRLIASRFWCGVSFGGRPILCPRATARARPSPVRARIKSLSNSARPPSTVSIKRPCDVVVSAHVSPRDLKPAFLAVIAASVFNRSRVDRARRVEPGDCKHVADVEHLEQSAKLCAVGLRAARHFEEDFFASGLGELAHLAVNALAVRRYPGIAVFHTL